MPVNKTCSDCIYFQPTQTIKEIGLCKVPVPYWVTVEFDAYAFVPAGNKGIAPLCQTFREEQLLVKLQELEDKLYYYKVQESLMRPIIDDNFKG